MTKWRDFPQWPTRRRKRASRRSRNRPVYAETGVLPNRHQERQHAAFVASVIEAARHSHHGQP